MVRTLVAAPLALVATLVNVALADVKFTKPTPGQKIDLSSGTATLQIAWTDSGDSPAISDLLSYQLFVVAGGQEGAGQESRLGITTSPITFSGNTGTAIATITTSIGADVTNAYFIKMDSALKAGGVISNFSPRFSADGATGVFAANVQEALADGDPGTAGPDTIKPAAAPAEAPDPADGEYGVAFTDQTGTIRYAPMQPVPLTKITAKNYKPLHPTSSYSVATTFLPTPKIQTTLTQAQTFSVSSRENTAAAAPNPTDDMQKFLNRWKD